MKTQSSTIVLPIPGFSPKILSFSSALTESVVTTQEISALQLSLISR